MGKYAILVVLTLSVALGYMGLYNNSATNDAIHETENQGQRKILQHLATGHANATLQKLRKLNQSTVFDPDNFNYTKSIPEHNATVTVQVDDVDSDDKLIIGEYKINVEVKDDEFTAKAVVFDRQLPFSYYALFLDNFPKNAYYGTGERVNGPFHSNSSVNVGGRPGPVFDGNVTATGVKYFAGASASNFKGFKGDNNNFSHPKIPLGKTLQIKPEDQAGAFKLDNAFTSNTDLYVNLTQNLAGEQIVEVFDVPYSDPKLKPGGHATNAEYEKYIADHKTVIKAEDLSNKILYSANKNIHVKGELDGKLNITTEKSIYLDDDVVYKDDPRKVPESDDMLGLMCNGDVIVSTRKDPYTGEYMNTRKDPDSEYDGLVVMANIYTTKSIKIENFRGGYVQEQDSLGNWHHKGVPQDRGDWTVVGGRVQANLGITMTSHGGYKSGFAEVIEYDTRFRNDAPPGVPYTNERRINRWSESF
ncbi:MAG: hypothetical protein CSB55_04530 [Candidatus Cloacimonadota bacterium]|nr:MAG: hypothetical protein CSB55_04530 [Candidatus Cloacimonadota bacterium]